MNWEKIADVILWTIAIAWTVFVNVFALLGVFGYLGPPSLF